MKKINYMMLSLLLALLGSCTEEEQQGGKQPVPDGGDNATARQEVTLNLKNKLVLNQFKTKGETIATAEENAIASLDVYVFASETESGEYSFMERFAYRSNPDDALPAGASQLQLTATDADAQETTGLLKVKKGLFVKLYCIANNTALIDPAHEEGPVGDAAFVPIDFTVTDDNKTTVTAAGQPLESTFTTWHTQLLTATTAADTLATPLAMTGALTTPLDLTDFGSAARVQAGIRLTRLVARYDIINKAESSRFTIETVSMGNARRGSNLFPIRPYGDQPEAKPHELITTPVRRFYGENANKGNQTGAFYSYPSPIKDNGFIILKGMYKINETESKEVSYQIPFTQQGKDGNQTFLEIANNHRYTIAITAADEYHLDFTLTVADWADDGNIDDFNPEQDSGELNVTIPDGFIGDTEYDPETRSISMSLKEQSQFEVTTTTTADLMVYKNYVGGLAAQQYDWLDVSTPAITTKAAAMNYKYTFSLKKEYTKGRYPRAVLRFTNTMNGSETTFFVEAVSVPQADNIKQPGENNPNSFDAEKLQVNLYRITKSNAHVRITCPDGVKVESKPEWLDVDIFKQNGSEIIYSFTLNNRDVTDVNENKGTVVFQNKKNNDLKTDITVQLLDAALQPDFTDSSLSNGKNSYEEPNGDTPANINMQISDDNKFIIPCKSMQGIEIGMDFDEGPAWLKAYRATATKALSENNEVTFSLDKAKLGGAKKATITLNNKVGGKNTVFTVSPVFLAPNVTFVSGSPVQNKMEGTAIKLYQVEGSKISIKASALGGTYVKTLDGNITVTAEDNYNAEKNYEVTWKSGTNASFVIANKSDETKETAPYTVNAPVTTITNGNGNVSLVTNNGQSISNTISSPEGFTASVDWGSGGIQWFNLNNSSFNAGNQTVTASQINDLSADGTIKIATVTLTNKIAGGQNLTYTVTPDFQAPVVTMASNNSNQLTEKTVTMHRHTLTNSTITLRAMAIGGTNITVSNNEFQITPATNSNTMTTDYVITLPNNTSVTSGTITFKNKANEGKTTTLSLNVVEGMAYPEAVEPAIELTNYWVAPTIFTGPQSATKDCPAGWFVPSNTHFHNMAVDGVERVKEVYCPSGNYWTSGWGSGPWFIYAGYVNHYMTQWTGFKKDASAVLNIRCIKAK